VTISLVDVAAIEGNAEEKERCLATLQVVLVNILLLIIC